MEQELLDKYFAGKCTPEEESLVRYWLAQPVSGESRLVEKSWLHIRAHMLFGKIRPLNAWPGYFAAASAVLLTVLGIAWKLSSQDFVIRNTSRHYEAFDTKGLQFQLPPQAAAHINTGIVSSSADLVFCGDVRIQNNSSNDVDIKLNLNCTNEEPDHITTLKVRKDKKYLAFQYYFKSDEIVVVEEDRIFDLPLPLQQKALKVLEI